MTLLVLPWWKLGVCLYVPKGSFNKEECWVKHKGWRWMAVKKDAVVQPVDSLAQVQPPFLGTLAHSSPWWLSKHHILCVQRTNVVWCPVMAERLIPKIWRRQGSVGRGAIFRRGIRLVTSLRKQPLNQIYWPPWTGSDLSPRLLHTICFDIK